MKSIFGTTAIIDEVSETTPPNKHNFWRLSANILLILLVGSIVSSALISPLLSFAMLKSGDAGSFLKGTDYNTLYNALNSWSIAHPNIFMVLQLFGTVGTIAVTIFLAFKFDGRRLATLGIFKNGAFAEYIVGLLIGAIMFSAVYGIMYLSGGVNFNGISTKLHIGALVAFLFAYMVQGMSEELLLRGYYMCGIGSFSSIPFSIFVSSIAFAILHFGNNGMSIFAFINIFLFGLFTALYFLRRGSIWGVAAIHATWNYVQGQIFGCNVSGNYATSSLFETSLNNKSAIFNGGAFGPEGGLAVTIVLVVGIIILIPMKNKRINLPLPRYRGEFHSAV